MKTTTYPPGRFKPRHVLRPGTLTVLLAVGVTSWSCAQAAPPTSTAPLTQSSVAVKLGDLDLTTEAGSRVAYQRIRAAAKQACGFTTHMGDYVVGARGVYMHCYDATMATAVKQVGRTQLAAIHDQASRVAGY